MDLKKLKEILIDIVASSAFGVLINAAGFVFNIIVVKLLSKGDYGIYASLFSIVFLFTIVSSTVQAVVIRTISANPKQNVKEFVDKYILRFLFVGLALILMYSLSTLLIHAETGIDYKYLLLVAIVIIPGFLTPLLVGVLYGLQKIQTANSVMLLEMVLRVILLLVITSIFGGPGAPFFAIAIPMYLNVAVLYYIISKISKGTAPAQGIQWKESLVTLCVILLLNIPFAVDILYISEQYRGDYGGLVLFGKIILYATLFAVNTFFAKFSEEKDPKAKIRLYGLALAVSAVIAVATWTVSILLRTQLINIVFGSEYMSLYDLIPLYSAAIGCFVLMYLTVYYLISEKFFWQIVVLIGVVVAQFVLFKVNNDGLNDYVMNQFIVFSSGFVILFLITIGRYSLIKSSK